MREQMVKSQSCNGNTCCNQRRLPIWRYQVLAQIPPDGQGGGSAEDQLRSQIARTLVALGYQQTGTNREFLGRLGIFIDPVNTFDTFDVLYSRIPSRGTRLTLRLYNQWLGNFLVIPSEPFSDFALIGRELLERMAEIAQGFQFNDPRRILFEIFQTIYRSNLPPG